MLDVEQLSPSDVTIETLMKEWSNDCQVDEAEPQRELANIPKLNAKYLNIMVHHKLLAKKATSNYYKMRRFKVMYYSGDLNNPEDLKEHNLEPFRKKILKQDMDDWLQADEELTQVLMKKIIHDEIVKYCEYVLKECHSRTFQLRSYIDYEKFLGGM